MSLGSLAGVSIPRPRRQQEKKPRVANRVHLAALVRVPVDEQTWPPCHDPVVHIDDLELSLGQHQPRVFVDLMLGQSLTSREVDKDRPTRCPRVDHFGVMREDVESTDSPTLHLVSLVDCVPQSCSPETMRANLSPTTDASGRSPSDPWSAEPAAQPAPTSQLGA